MTGKRIIYYILAAFIAGNLLLIYIQYNSTKNINTLIKENEKLLKEFQVSSELKELERDVISMESKIRGAISTKDTLRAEGLEGQIAEVEANLDQLQKISDDDSTVKYVDALDQLVREKLYFNRQIMDSFHLAGKNAAENIIATQRGKILTDSITLITHRIDSTRQKLLADVTMSIDESGKKAQRFGAILIVLVLIGGAVLFWYIINTIRNQIQLIRQLNISEKNVREAAQIKEKFLANMSHEIRTPMNAILGFTNLLRRKSMDAESEEYIKTIQHSGENLLAIINDILDLSKIEAGMMRIEAAPFSIRGLLHSIEAMFKTKATEKRLKFSTQLDESIPDTLEGDATRLTQILVNLIGNALKFTNEGSVSVKITNEENSDTVIKIGITIIDTGIGIKKDKLENIFDRFQQAEDSVTRKYGGTGLGLSIVNDLVVLQNGTIEVESEPGKGTAFSLIMPYKVSTEQFNAIAAEQDNLTIQSDFENVCILVVEDNEINQRLIQHLFNNWQLKFNLAGNGREAIEKIKANKNKYNLILMDIQMPEMDGYTAAQEIRNRLNLDIPIIAMTAHALAGEREKCLSYGMNEYISKPIRQEQLQKMIGQFTRLRKPVSQTEPGVKSATAAYEHINLRYMKEISGGNAEYEKTVTEQFIDAIPDDLIALDKAWLANDITHLRQLAHNMRTTLSIMGLDEILQPYLDGIEYEEQDRNQLLQGINYIRITCTDALAEAKLFLKTF